MAAAITATTAARMVTGAVLSDAAGNIVQMPQDGQVLTLSYGADNRLTQTSTNQGAQGRYLYDASGLRAEKTSRVPSEQTRDFIYDGAHLLGEYVVGAGTPREYVWLGDSLIASLDSSARGYAIHYIGTDFLGTPRSVTDAQGMFVWNWAYAGNAFGDGVATGTYELGLRFPGQYYDAESGMHYNMSRDYQPALGIYVASDPLGLKGGASTYSYARSSPINTSDPSGLFYLGRTSAGSGGVYCDYGTWKPVVVVPWLYNQCPAIGKCAYVHEQSHIADVQRVNPGLCHWYSPLLSKNFLVASTAAERISTELKAYAAELACLRAYLESEPCKDGDCNYYIKMRINNIKSIYIPQVLSDNYGSR